MMKRYLKIKSLVFVMYFGFASLIFISFSPAQNFRKPTIRLEVKIKDKVVAEKDTVSIKLGEKIQLQVSKKRLSGGAEAQDVTTDEKIHYQVLTPWSLTVSPEGLLESKYPSRTDNIPASSSSNRGFLSITYGAAGGDEVGSQFVNFFVDFSGKATSLPVNDTNQEISSTHVVDNVKKPGVEKTDIKSSNAASVTKPVDFSSEAFKGNVPADILELLNNKETQHVIPDEIHSQENGTVDNFDPAFFSDEEQQDLSTMDLESEDSTSEDPISEVSTPEDSGSESQQADFIDYDQLRKMQKIKESIPSTKPPNPSLNLTPEERQLYDDALKQP